MASRSGAARRSPRRVTPDAAALDAQVTERVLAAAPDAKGGPLPAVSRAVLTRKLPARLRPRLAAALAALEASRRLLLVRHGRAVLVVFGAIRADAPAEIAPSVAPSPPAPAPPALTETEVFTRYEAAVAAARGWPDVRLSALLSDPAELPALHAALSALWRAGRAVLSLGDWSLAAEEQRAAALSLHGERYLLVRIDPP